MKSFRNAQGVLTAYGYVESNGDDAARDEDEDFNLEPGAWQLVDDEWVPASTFNKAAALQRLRDKRKIILDALTGVAGRAARKGLTSVADAADTAAQGLLDLPKHPLVVAAASDDQFDATVLYLYRQLAAACPPVVQAAFLEAV